MAKFLRKLERKPKPEELRQPESPDQEAAWQAIWQQQLQAEEQIARYRDEPWFTEPTDPPEQLWDNRAEAAAWLFTEHRQEQQKMLEEDGYDPRKRELLK